MLLHEKQAVYWQLATLETEEVCQESKLDISDFMLGSMDTEALGEEPPEYSWIDWFPPPRRMMDWELGEITDWVEIEAAKHDLIQKPDISPVDL